MGNPFLDALSDVGYALDTPGAYLRGALSGKLGERASGEDMLGSWGMDAGPLGGMAAEMVADPLALAGLAGGAYKGLQGVQKATRAARGMVEADDLARGGLRLQSGLRDGTAYSELLRGDEVVGHALSTARPGFAEKRAHRNPAFQSVLPEGAPLARFNEVGFFDAPFGQSTGSPYQGKGLGQQMMVDSLAQNPVQWLYNSQASPAAASMYERLRDKGLLNLTWDTRGGVPDVGAAHVMSLTDAGRAMAGTGGLVHPGVLGGGQPLNPLARALAGFVGDESGALRPFQEIGRRTDPDFVNSVPWYHGSGTSGITPQSIDVRKTDTANLMGPGLYKTAAVPLGAEYAAARFGDQAARWGGAASSAVRSLDVDPSVLADTAADLVARLGDLGPRFGLRAQDIGKELAAFRSGANPRNLRRSLGEFLESISDHNTALRPMAGSVLESRGYAVPPLPKKTVYEAATNYGNILDLDQPLSAMKGLDDVLHKFGSYSSAPALTGSEKTAGDLVQAMRDRTIETVLRRPGPPQFVTSDRYAGTRALREAGYDALTHTGGLRAGGGDRLHDVLIGLDPNDTISNVGRANQITRFDALPPQQLADLMRQIQQGGQ